MTPYYVTLLERNVKNSFVKLVKTLNIIKRECQIYWEYIFKLLKL